MVKILCQAGHTGQKRFEKKKRTKKYIGVETGESIIYIYQTDKTVKIAKAEEKLDIDSIVDSVMDQYNQPLKDLVDL